MVKSWKSVLFVDEVTRKKNQHNSKSKIDHIQDFDFSYFEFKYTCMLYPTSKCAVTLWMDFDGLYFRSFPTERGIREKIATFA